MDIVRRLINDEMFTFDELDKLKEIHKIATNSYLMQELRKNIAFLIKLKEGDVCEHEPQAVKRGRGRPKKDINVSPVGKDIVSISSIERRS